MELSVDQLILDAIAARNEKRLKEAKDLLVGAISRARSESLTAQLIRGLCELGRLHRDLGMLEKALTNYLEAAETADKSGLSAQQAHALRHLGDIARESKQVDRAMSYYQRALELYRTFELAPTLNVANTLRGIALVAQDSQPDLARTYWTEARALYHDAKVEAGVQECDRRLAELRAT